ncbi:hypothetical protein SH591_00515 [Sphingomonas sp. LY54]|uniref:hypothetical protein n=1 Tax=Sphingomonas sp. LY54 TaxID=3095343 RepID=UPI002D7675FF|nr:hypothetical protein [Sphingomonas sp. LY54]WRP28706.1 hypothetical protein SH591_00515 [Sphingomonas sp. LY54]
MAAFDQIEEVRPSPQFGNTGPEGWGFTLWGGACAEDVHRNLLEGLAKTYPTSSLTLPPWYDGEDLVEGSLTWQGVPIWVWFETVLNHTYLWSADQAAVVSLREALLPIARSMGSR